jgi:hypothetical protein
MLLERKKERERERERKKERKKERKEKKRKEPKEGKVNWLVWLLFYAHRHRSILGVAGHIILTPANQLMVMGLKIWSLSNSGSNQKLFDHWPQAYSLL